MLKLGESGGSRGIRTFCGKGGGSKCAEDDRSLFGFVAIRPLLHISASLAL